MPLVIYIDGGSRGNPGPAAAGVVLLDADSRQPLHEAGYFLGRTTNNVAEYQALLKALTLAAQFDVDEVLVHSDSQLLVRQIAGEYRVKSEDLRPLYTKALALLKKFSRWQVVHVLRDKNKRADELANMAMDRKGDAIDHDLLQHPESADFVTSLKEGHMPCPRWRVTLRGEPDQCKLDCQTGQSFEFGPATPAGLCVHAATAIFNASPLDAGRGLNEQTQCARCRLSIHLQALNED